MNEPRILIAGIGNIFFGDDAFGVEVVCRLGERPWPEGVVVKDFGIRGLDLAYALMDGWDRVILIDAAPRGDPPGTLYLLELDEAGIDGTADLVDTHGMNPMKVLSLVKSLGGPVPSIRLVGCEPATLGSEEEPAPELSAPVAAAVGAAIVMIEALVTEARQCNLATAHGCPGHR
jgi:hydrogenase maturation protease